MTLLATTVVALAACDPLSGIEPELVLCLDGPCGPGGAVPEHAVLGLPQTAIDRGVLAGDGGYLLQLPVGASVPLHFVRVPSKVPLMQTPDTIRNVSWSTSGSAATITVGADGIARLQALSPGRVTVQVNGTAQAAYACGATPEDGCFRVGEIGIQ